MVAPSRFSGLAAVAFLASLAAAHPGEKHDHAKLKRDIEARDAMAWVGKRSLGNCANSPAARALHKKNIERRSKVAADLRKKRDIKGKAQKFRRDLATLEEFEAVNHNETGVYDWSMWTTEELVFAANTSCILTPEVTDGPYYVTGEMIRENVKEAEYSDGVDMWLEVQYIDFETCEPVPNVWVDIWNANATGVYSGIVATGNVAADGWDSTYLRGVQVTNLDGIVTFNTIFPGHYTDRATHTHLLSHTNVTVFENQTISTGTVSHIGQLFYPTELRDVVEKTYPYNTNTQDVTTNDEDMWSIVQAADGYDPFPEFLYLGDDISDGLMAWIQIGLNTSQSLNDDDYFAVAAYRDSTGGHEESSSGSFAGGDGGAAPSGASGAMPSGAAPSGGF